MWIVDVRTTPAPCGGGCVVFYYLGCRGVFFRRSTCDTARRRIAAAGCLCRWGRSGRGIYCQTCSSICNVTDMGTHLRQCPICSTEVPADVPMVAAEVGRRRNRRERFWYRREPICMPCARSSWNPESPDGKTSALHHGADGVTSTCEVCNQLVVLQPDKRRKVVTCSDRCRLSRYKTKRVPSSVTCDVCGKTFAARAGARYCSPACRQKAYRDRK